MSPRGNVRAFAVTVWINWKLSPVRCGHLNLTLSSIDVDSLKATVPRGNVERLSCKESVKRATTVLWGSVHKICPQNVPPKSVHRN